MNIIIRNERADDYRSVETLTREAFWNLYVPGCDEHYLVHIMRNHPDFLPELAFVAEVDGEIVGSIFYTKSWLVDENGDEKEIRTFGPLCVHPSVQRKGIGTALINHTADIVRAQGFPAIVIMGSPFNYCKHGFKNGLDFKVSDENGDYPYGLLVLELKTGALDGTRWKYRYSDVYNFDPEQVEPYDQTFPVKQKEWHYSQELFSISIRSFLRDM